MALLLIRPEFDQWLPGEHNGTFRGNGHAFVTGRAALDKFWATTRFADDVTASSALVGRRLRAIAGGLPGTRVRGRGMMQGVDLGSSTWAADVARRCFDAGLLIETCGPRDEVVKVMAPLTTPDDLLGQGLDILADAIDSSSGPAT
jgi:diaminobutyrate-2-oxoglutarate transaminase